MLDQATNAEGIAGDERDDVALIAASRTGEQTAYAELWRRHREAALRTARPLARSDAEDVVAEAFASIWIQIRNGQGPREYFRAYALTVVRNISARWYRDRQRILTGVEFDGDPVPGGDALLEVSEDQQEILAAFETLPERWRQILWWMEVDQLSRTEAAERLELSPNSVSVLMRRAKEGLRIAWMHQQLPDATELDHADLAYLLPKYVRGGLEGSRLLEVEKHLQNCVQCRKIERDLSRENHRLGGSFVAGAVASLVGITVVSTSVLRPTNALAATTAHAEMLDSAARAFGFSKTAGPVGAGIATLSTGAVSIGVISAILLSSLGGTVSTPQDGATGRPLGSEQAPERVSAAPSVTRPEADRASDDGDAPSDGSASGDNTNATPDEDEAGPSPTKPPPTTDPTDPVDPQSPFTVVSANGIDGAIAPQLSGTSTPGSQLGVSVAGYSFTTAVAADGTWSTDLAALPLGAGTQSAVLSRDENGSSVVVGQVDFALSTPLVTTGIVAGPGPQTVPVAVSGVPGSQMCIELGPEVYQRVPLDANGWGTARVTVDAANSAVLNFRYCSGNRFGPVGQVGIG